MPGRTVTRSLLLLLAPLALAGCPPTTSAHLYKTMPVAPSYNETDVAAMAHLGAHRVDQGVDFGVYSGHATRVDLLLFDDPESSKPTRELQMKRFGDVWNLYVEGVGLGQYYDYVAWGPNWKYDPGWYPGSIKGFVADVDTQGNRFDPNKALRDPYALAVSRDHDWSKGSLASGPARTQSTWAAAAKSVVVESQYHWSANETQWRQDRENPDWQGHKWNDLIIYETHPKGFTADPASGVKFPGTYKGIGEKADYLKKLGINAVELMPVMEKPLDGGYWGYQTLNFFAPELTYAAADEGLKDIDDGRIIDEFKWMVDQLHQAGIEVILDVVYNHTGEGGLWREKLQFSDTNPDPGTADSNLVNLDPQEVASLYSYRGLDNISYYALVPSDPRFYMNDTGVGDTSRDNYRPMHQLILDSLHYWASEMHVDGFRFDLAPVLGEKDRVFGSSWDPKNTVLQEIIDDPLLQKYDTRIIAEPWSVTGFHLGDFPVASNSSDGRVAFYEWNGNFRDWWRSFLNNDSWTLNTHEGKIDGGGALTGSYDLFHANGRHPYHSVNFVTIHDGFTMYDLFSYNVKQNGCGPLNPVCCDHPTSPFCTRDDGENNNRSRKWDSEDMKRQLMRDMFTAMMISEGTPMLLGGDEWMRTQLGNNNAYSTGADNSHNWYQWGEWQAKDPNVRMHDFVQKIIAFRKSHLYAFAPADYGTAQFTWDGTGAAGNPDWSSRHIAMYFDDGGKDPRLEVLINMETSPVTFTLHSGSWERLLDTQQYFDSDTYLQQGSLDPKVSHNITLKSPDPIPGTQYEVQPRSIVVLQATP